VAVAIDASEVIEYAMAGTSEPKAEGDARLTDASSAQTCSMGNHGHSHGVVVGSSSQRQVKVNSCKLDEQCEHVFRRLKQMS
jgi:hypothetical protein